MAVKGITKIYLYTDETEASVKARRYLEDNGIPFQYLHYWDPEQHPKVFAPLKTWRFKSGEFDVNSFPFVIFEVVDDARPAQLGNQLDFVAGDLSKSNIVSLYRMGH